ncbi:MAG: PAS domain-containing protein [Anaerolineales bacterium]
MDPEAGREAAFDLLRRLASALSELLKPTCEVVIHDFTDLEHSIICIEGNLTGRSVGGAATDLLLSMAQRGDTDKDLESYITSLPNGKGMKSSTVFLRDDRGKAFAAFCVNVDITELIALDRKLRAFLTTKETEGISELFSDDIRETVQSMVEETLYEIDTPAAAMNREDKIKFVGRLNNKGVFQVKRAVPIVADLLGLSRATIYNYLRELNDRDRRDGGEG